MRLTNVTSYDHIVLTVNQKLTHKNRHWCVIDSITEHKTLIMFPKLNKPCQANVCLYLVPLESKISYTHILICKFQSQDIFRIFSVPTSSLFHGSQELLDLNALGCNPAFTGDRRRQVYWGKADILMTKYWSR